MSRINEVQALYRLGNGGPVDRMAFALGAVAGARVPRRSGVRINGSLLVVVPDTSNLLNPAILYQEGRNLLILPEVIFLDNGARDIYLMAYWWTIFGAWPYTTRETGLAVANSATIGYGQDKRITQSRKKTTLKITQLPSVPGVLVTY